ncbi:hypothetical protein GOP47_0023108 [Adiantum capillus-veneris]|uniref:Pentatricopeptide repeat-containing protein n=1 Tax=Adiantum capillus-veneris TaxID=13818 RepID=A0A9D4U6P1_ADICA|nr:hypothetical protein GOP47_0023108 [Adiantum capillus-veneris]
MRHRSIETDKKTIFTNLLKVCSSAQSLTVGRLVYEEIVRTGLDSSTNFCNMIMNLYMRFYSIEDARRVFDRLKHPDVVSWGTMIMGYTSHGHGLCALVLFDNMQDKGILPNSVVLLGLLKACLNLGDLQRAFQAHDQVVRYGLEADVILGSMLINVYNKLGIIEEGLLLFQKLQDGNIVTWGSLIAGYVHHEDGLSALQLLEQMKQMGISADNFVYSCGLKACNLVNSLGQGKRLHVQLMYCNLKSDVVVENCLIDMYAKCGELDAANKVFDNMVSRSVITWGALIAGHVQHGDGEIALELHNEMQKEGLKPDIFTSSCLLKASGTTGDLQRGRCIHEYIVRRGYSADTIIKNSLIDMYARCGSLEDAENVFEGLHSLDLVSWDSMIAGLVQHGKGVYALEMFLKMQEKGIHPDDVSYLSILKACGDILAIEQGRLFNEQIVLKGFDSDIIVGNALIDMYIKCGSLEEARRVFDKLPERAEVSWAVMISGYAEHEKIWPATQLLTSMYNENVYSNDTTLLCILKACSKMRALNSGRQMHAQVLSRGYDVDLAINNTLVDMYAKCGSLQEARKVFDVLPNRTIVTWDTLISGYVLHGDGLSALGLWRKMCEEDVIPIKVTFLSILKACCSVGAIEQGRLLYHHIIWSGLEIDLSIGNTVLDMFLNCGILEDANQLFDNMESPDLVSWTTSIAGKAYCGNYTSARQTLRELQSRRLKPNEDLFLSLLRACRQAGLVKEGHRCFQSMVKEHGLTPGIEHYSCMVDMLGHAGVLKEATNFIQAMTCEPDAVVWTSLLASSNFYGNVELGNFCLNKLDELNNRDSLVYELISKDVELQEDLITSDELQVVPGVQHTPQVVWSENRGMVGNFAVRSSNYFEDDTSLSKGTHPSQEKDMPHVDFSSQSKHEVMDQSNSFGNICAKQAGAVEQQQVECDNCMHYMAVRVC